MASRFPPPSPSLSADYSDLALPEYSNDDDFHLKPPSTLSEAVKDPAPEYSFYAAPKDKDDQGFNGYSNFVPTRDPDAPNIVVSTASNGLVSTEQQLAIDTPYLSFADRLFTKYRDCYQIQNQGKNMPKTVLEPFLILVLVLKTLG